MSTSLWLIYIIDEKKKALKSLLGAPSAEVERAALKGELINSAKKRMKLARDYTVCFFLLNYNLRALGIDKNNRTLSMQSSLSSRIALLLP